MSKFTDHITKNLSYEFTLIDKSEQDVFLWSIKESKPVWICYLTEAIDPEKIRRSFTDFKGFILYVVDDKLIPQDIESRTKTPMWLRVLHGLYMGRVYTWNDRHLYGLHFDYDEGEVTESGIISPAEMVLFETDTLLRGWNDKYRIARFRDPAWWSVKNPYQKAYEDIGRKREQAQNQQRYYTYEQQRTQPPAPKQESQSLDFKAQFKACSNAQEAKTLFKKLARQYHPDLNPGTDTTVIMQQVNAAWDYMRDWWD